MKRLFAMLFLAGSLGLGLGESAPSSPEPPKRSSAHPSYLVLGGFSLVVLLAWRRSHQARH